MKLLKHLNPGFYDHFYRRPRKNLHFDGRGYLLGVALHILVYVPVFLFVALVSDVSMAGLYFLSVMLISGLLIWHIFMSWYDMGAAWKLTSLAVLFGSVVLLSIFLYPKLFGTQLFPGTKLWP